MRFWSIFEKYSLDRVITGRRFKKIICIIKQALDLTDAVAKVVLLPVGVVGGVGAGDGGRDAHVELQQLPLLNKRQECK
jgi:hypothetical protein